MSITTDLAMAAAGLLVGAALGWSPAEAPVRPNVGGAHVPSVCRRTTVDAPACADVEVRRDWCAARLRAATRVRPTSAPPEAVGVDDPVAWERRLGELVNRCQLPAVLENTDCTEYPCVTALRPTVPGGLEDPADACAGASPLAESEWAALVPTPVDCGDGRVQTMWMIAVVDQETLNDLYPAAKGEFLPDSLTLLAARRAEALARGWSCSE